MRTSEKIDQLAVALLAARAEFKPFHKDKENKNPLFSRGGKGPMYADFGTIVDATQEALSKNGLMILQGGPETTAPDVTAIETVLVHSSGQFMAFTLTVPSQAPGKDGSFRLDAQTACAGQTYGRRYGWQAILALVADEDDDGNAASLPRADVPSAQTPLPSHSGTFTRVGTINMAPPPKPAAKHEGTILFGVLKSVTEGKKKDGSTFLKLQIIKADETEVSVSAFDNKTYADKTTLFGLLRAAQHQRIELAIKQSGNYLNLDFPCQIGETEFDTFGPVIQRGA
jgi:hypothetical protein